MAQGRPVGVAGHPAVAVHQGGVHHILVLALAVHGQVDQGERIPGRQGVGRGSRQPAGDGPAAVDGLVAQRIALGLDAQPGDPAGGQQEQGDHGQGEFGENGHGTVLRAARIGAEQSTLGRARAGTAKGVAQQAGMSPAGLGREYQ